jgi:hypothetical protein
MKSLLSPFLVFGCSHGPPRTGRQGQKKRSPTLAQDRPSGRLLQALIVVGDLVDAAADLDELERAEVEPD